MEGKSDRDFSFQNLLIISTNAGGQLITLTAFPPTGKQKGIYMMKKDPTIPIIKDDGSFRENLIYGDLAPQPLESLVSYIEEVIN